MSGEASSKQKRPFRPSGIGIWFARSFSSGNLLGSIQESRVGLFGIQLSRLLIPTFDQAESGYAGPTLTYTADLIPLAHLGIPVESRPQDLYRNQPTRTSDLSVFGTGAYPLGIRVAFRSNHRVRPFLAGHTGLLYFFDHIPDDRGRKANFAVGLGGGVSVAFGEGTSMTVGYRFHHLSNGFRGSINPGLDANVLYLGLGTNF